jgi:hypothetical protein
MIGNVSYEATCIARAIDRLDLARMLPDANQYAHILQNAEIKYLLGDINIKGEIAIAVLELQSWRALNPWEGE